MKPIQISEYEPRERPQQRFDNLSNGYGSPMTVVYGRRWVSPIVLMQGATLAKGYGWFKDSDGTWKNEACVLASALLGLCEGPIAGVRAIMRDGTTLPVLTNSAAYLSGAPGMGGVSAPLFFDGSQTTLGVSYPSGEPPYFGTACFWGTRWTLKNGQWPTLKFLVDGFLGDANGVCDPVAVLRDLWTNPRYGLGLDGALLDTTLGVDGNSASGYAAWIASRGWKIARAITGYEGALEAIQTLLYETHARMFGSPDGLVKIVPLAPVPPLTPQALDQDDFLMGGDSTVPVVVERVQQADVFNVVPVEIEYSNDTSADNVTVAYEDTSLADAATGGIKRSDPYQAKWIVSPTHATQLSFLLGQRSLKVRNRFRFKLGTRWTLLTPGDLVSMTEPVLGLSGAVAMITSTEESPKGEIQIFAEEWTSQTNPPTGSPAPPEGFTDPGGEGRTDPQPVTAPDLSAIELRLANIASDSRLTNDEKGYLVAQMQTLFADRAVLLATAGNFTPVIPTTNYSTALAALLAYARAAVPADADEATGSNGLGLPGTDDPPTAQNYSDWYLTPSGIQDGKINIVGATLRQKFGDAITEAALLKLAITDRNTGRIDNLEDYIGHVGGDGWLSSTEKRGVWSIYDGLRDEHAVLSVSAAAANVASLAAYNTAIQNLKNYVKAPQPGNGVTPVDGTAQTNPTHGLNMGLDSLGVGTLTDSPTDAQVSAWLGYDTAIHGATFRKKFSDALNAANQVYIEMASDAWQRIQNYASDAVLSKAEKPAVFYEYVALLAERAQIDTAADASTLLVSGTLAQAVDADHQAYKQALWNLQNYMNDVLGCPPDAGTGSPTYTTTVPVVANLTTWEAAGSANGIVGDSAIVPSAFLAVWQDVYVKKAALLRRISEESTNLASSAYGATITLGSSKAEKDMSNITGTAISQALARNNDLMTAALLAADVKGDGTNPVSWLSANAIGAAAIASDSVLARHILVSDFGGAALNKNPSCSDLSAWGAPSAPWPATATGVTVQAVSDGKVGRSALRSNAATSAAIMSERVPVDPAKRYRIRAWARASVASLGGFRLALMFFDGSDAVIAAPDGFGTGNYWFTPSGAQTLGTTWTESKGFFGGTGWTRGTTEGGAVPATARTMAVAILFNQGAAAGYHEAQDIRIEEQVNADLMVDGAITGNKIAGGAITAGHLSVFPTVSFTTDGSTLPSILTDASVGLPATGRHASIPGLLVDMTRTVSVVPNPKVFEGRFRGSTGSRGFVFNIASLAGTTQQIVAVMHDGAFIRLQSNNALDASWSTAVSKAAAAPTVDEVLTVHWYNSPVQAPDGNTYRCRVYIDGTLAASFTTGECAGLTPSANLDLTGNYAGIVLGTLAAADGTLRSTDCLLGQAGIILADGMVKLQHLDTTSINFVAAGSIIATINASTEGGGTLKIAANKVTIGGATTFESANYDPTTKETPTGAQDKADAAAGAAQSAAAGDATTKANAARDAALLAAQQLTSQTLRPAIVADLTGSAPAAPLSTFQMNSAASPEGYATRLTSTGTDPQLSFDVSGQVPGDVYAVAARIRFVSGTWQGDCYYNASGLAYSDSRKVTKAQPVAGEWALVVWDLRSAANFNSATGLTSIRLDLGNSSGTIIDVDWVAVGRMGVGDSALDVLNDDNVISPVEKASVKPLCDALAAEAPGLAAQANGLGVAAATIQAYSNTGTRTGAVEILADLLTACGLWGTMTTATRLDGGGSGNLLRTGDNLRTRIQNVLTAKQTLVNATAQRAYDKAYSDAQIWASQQGYVDSAGAYSQATQAIAARVGAWDGTKTVIDGGNISTGSIKTTSLLVIPTVGAALNSDPNCQDVSAWSLGGATQQTISYGKVGNYALRGVSGQHTFSALFPVAAGKTYRAHSWTRGGSPNGIFILRIYWYSAAGTELSFSDCASQSGPPAATWDPWAEYEGKAVAPTNAVYGRVVVIQNYGGTVGYIESQDIRCEQVIGKGLLEADVIQTSDYASSGSGVDEVASRGARLRNNVATDLGSGREIPAIITSPAGIKVGHKILSEAWLSQGKLAISYLNHVGGQGSVAVTPMVGSVSVGVVSGSTGQVSITLGTENAGKPCFVMFTGRISGSIVAAYPGTSSWSVDAYGVVTFQIMSNGGNAYGIEIYNTSWSGQLWVMIGGSAWD